VISASKYIAGGLLCVAGGILGGAMIIVNKK
jgi:hypothetical protein